MSSPQQPSDTTDSLRYRDNTTRLLLVDAVPPARSWFVYLEFTCPAVLGMTLNVLNTSTIPIPVPAFFFFRTASYPNVMTAITSKGIRLTTSSWPIRRFTIVFGVWLRVQRPTLAPHKGPQSRRGLDIHKQGLS